jgi:hypothetical protein
LEDYRDAPVRVLVVWEPILASDIAPPTTGTLARIADRRAMQFWDEHRVASQEIARAIAAGQTRLPLGYRHPLRSDTTIWDFVAVFPAGSRWDGALPVPDFHGDPVVRAVPGVRAWLAQHVAR